MVSKREEKGKGYANLKWKGNFFLYLTYYGIQKARGKEKHIRKGSGKEKRTEMDRELSSRPIMGW